MNVAVVVPGGVAPALQATPLLRTLRAGVPEAHITLVCSGDAVSVADGIAPVDSTLGVRGLEPRSGGRAAARLWLELRRRRLDAVLLCNESWLLRLALFLSGVPRRVGPGRGLSAILLTAASRWDRKENNASAWLRIASLAGIRQELHSPAFEPGPEARREGDRIINLSGLGDGRLLVALAPGTGFLERDSLPAGNTAWDAERFAHLANLLAQRHGAGIIFLGTVSDRPVIEQTMLDLGTAAVDLSGHQELRVLAAILARCDLVVSGDTFLLHLAAAVGTAAVGLYGPTDGRRRGPYGDDHRIIQAVRRSPVSPPSMDQIRVEDVLASIEASL